MIEDLFGKKFYIVCHKSHYYSPEDYGQDADLEIKELTIASIVGSKKGLFVQANGQEFELDTLCFTKQEAIDRYRNEIVKHYDERIATIKDLKSWELDMLSDLEKEIKGE